MKYLMVLLFLPLSAFASNQALICDGAVNHHANLQLEFGGGRMTYMSVEMGDEEATYTADFTRKRTNRRAGTVTFTEARGQMKVVIPLAWVDRGFDRRPISESENVRFVYAKINGVEHTLSLTHCESSVD